MRCWTQAGAACSAMQPQRPPAAACLPAATAALMSPLGMADARFAVKLHLQLQRVLLAQGASSTCAWLAGEGLTHCNCGCVARPTRPA